MNSPVVERLKKGLTAAWGPTERGAELRKKVVLRVRRELPYPTQIEPPPCGAPQGDHISRN
eukprot:1191393-Prorocentrum_minimum.AAC.1